MKRLHILCVPIAVMASAFLGAVTTGCSDEPDVAPLYNEQDSLALCAIMATAPKPKDGVEQWVEGDVHTLTKYFTVVWGDVEGEPSKRIIRLEMLTPRDIYKTDGTISDAIGELTALTQLVISGINWTGDMPNSMKNLENLRELRIVDTDLQSLPDSMNLRHCEDLEIHANTNFRSLFHGIEDLGVDIPSWWPKFVNVNIVFNNFTGAIPNFNRPNIIHADLTENLFTSVDYESILEYASFNANYNYIRNEIPENMMYPGILKRLYVAVGIQKYGELPQLSKDSM